MTISTPSLTTALSPSSTKSRYLPRNLSGCHLSIAALNIALRDVTGSPADVVSRTALGEKMNALMAEVLMSAGHVGREASGQGTVLKWRTMGVEVD